jgi:hypothetical protein
MQRPKLIPVDVRHGIASPTKLTRSAQLYLCLACARLATNDDQPRVDAGSAISQQLRTNALSVNPIQL